MKRIGRPAMLVAAAAVVIAAAMNLRGEEAPKAPSPELALQGRTPASPSGQTGRTEAAGASAEAARPVIRWAPEPATEPVVRPLKIDDLLARVNGKEIRGRDLAPFPPGKAEVTMTDELKAFLLERAIVREVVTEECEKQGITLSETGARQLAAIEAQLDARRGGQVLEPKSVDHDEVAFEVREAEGFLLEAALLDKLGAGTPDVTDAEVWAHHRSAGSRYEPLPENPAERGPVRDRVSAQIRAELAPAAAERYTQRRGELLAGLLGGARIERAQ